VGLSRLPRDGSIGLDTSIFIYYIGEHREWIDAVDSLFAKALSADRRLVTSELTLCETLVLPYRAADLPLVERYEQFLSRSAGLTLMPIDRSLLHAAAQLRAQYRIKTPDAIQVAAALKGECTSFITNDRKLPEIAGLKVIQLSELA
jgi:predicted nucleic acid-binding protein